MPFNLEDIEDLTHDEELVYYKKVSFLIEDMAYYLPNPEQFGRYVNTPLDLVYKVIKKMIADKRLVYDDKGLRLPSKNK